MGHTICMYVWMNDSDTGTVTEPTTTKTPTIFNNDITHKDNNRT